MKMDLDPFQVEGAAFLVNAPCKGPLLADEPGLGKTRQAIRAALDWLPFGSVGPVAVVCPASAIGVWRRETAAFGGAAKWHIRSFEKARELLALPYLVLVVDEAHKCKTRDSQRTMAVLGEKCDGLDGLAARAAKVILLTGTPTPNNPSEIWPMARACFPEAIAQTFEDGTTKPMSYWQFVARYCKVKQNYLGHMQIVGGKNLDELRARLAPFVLRRRKADVLGDLPAARHSILPIEARFPSGPEVSDEVRQAASALAAEGVEGLAKIAPHVATLRRLTGIALVQGLADWVRDWFEGGGGKLVVYAYHKEVMRGLHARFVQDGVAHTVGRGAGNAGEVLFQESGKGVCDLFLGQLEADGTAITLTAASTFVFAEFDWVPANNDQPWQRIHRRGQKNACDVRYATIAGSIHEGIADALIPKREAIDKLWNTPVDPVLALL